MGFIPVSNYGAVGKDLEFPKSRFSGFDLGLVTKLAPTEIPVGRRHNGAIYSRNMNYDARTMASRKGCVPVTDNAVGAAKIADFESGESWSGGSADTVNFVAHEAVADGTQGRKVGQTGPGTGTSTLTGLSLVLRTNIDDSIHLWCRLNTLGSVTDWELKARIKTDASNYFEKVLFHDGSDEITDGDLVAGGDLYSRTKKHEWSEVGSPVWSNITELEIRVTITTGAGNVEFTLDNWFEAPARVEALFQYRRNFDASGRAGDKTEYAIAGGNLYKFDSSIKRWLAVSLPVDGDENPAPANAVIKEGAYWSVAFNFDRAYLTNGLGQFKLVQDGTPYGIGIVPPAKGTFILATSATGGNLSDGTYYVVVAFYSKKNGLLSAPDDKVTGVTITLSGGTSTQTIDITSLPRSTDPQVEWVRIFARSSVDTAFRRVSDSVDGEVANGTGSYNITNAPSDWGDEIDPDTDEIPLSRMFQSYEDFLLFVPVSAPAQLGYSNAGFPENQDVSNRVKVGENDNDVITALAKYRRLCFAFKNDAVIYGRAIAGGEVVLGDSISERGCDSFRTPVVVGNRLYWKSEDGIYYLDTTLKATKVTELNHKGPVKNLDNWNQRIDPYYVNEACAFQSKSRFQYHLFFRSKGGRHNDYDWVIHAARAVTAGGGVPDLSEPYGGTTIHTISAMSVTEVEGDGDLQELWIANTNGVVCKTDQENADKDDGRSYEARHGVPIWSPNSDRNYSFIGIRAEGDPLQGNVNVDYRVGLGDLAGKTAVLSTAGASTPISSIVFGTTQLGAGQAFNEKVDFQPNTGRHLQLDFWRKGGPFDLSAYTVYWLAEGWR